MIERKQHLTSEGRAEIDKIRTTMNRSKYSSFNASLKDNPQILERLKTKLRQENKK